MSPQEFDAQVIAMMDPPTTVIPEQQDRAKWWNAERAAWGGQCVCGGRGYHANPDEGETPDVYCMCPAGTARWAREVPQ